MGFKVWCRWPCVVRPDQQKGVAMAVTVKAVIEAFDFLDSQPV